MANIDLPFNARNGITTGLSQALIVDSVGNITAPTLYTGGTLYVAGTTTAGVINSTSLSTSVVTATSSISSPLIYGVPTVIGNSATTAFKISDPGNVGHGAEIGLFGNGGTTPNKYLRAFNGNFDIINSGYTSAVFSLSDAGNLTLTGLLNAPAGVFANSTIQSADGSGAYASLGANGDIHAVRSGGTTGAIFLNAAGSKYLYFDGSNYVMPGANLYVNGQVVSRPPVPWAQQVSNGTIYSFYYSGRVKITWSVASITTGGGSAVFWYFYFNGVVQNSSYNPWGGWSSTEEYAAATLTQMYTVNGPFTVEAFVGSSPVLINIAIEYF